MTFRTLFIRTLFWSRKGLLYYGSSVCRLSLQGLRRLEPLRRDRFYRCLPAAQPHCTMPSTDPVKRREQQQRRRRRIAAVRSAASQAGTCATERGEALRGLDAVQSEPCVVDAAASFSHATCAQPSDLEKIVEACLHDAEPLAKWIGETLVIDISARSIRAVAARLYQQRFGGTFAQLQQLFPFDDGSAAFSRPTFNRFRMLLSKRDAGPTVMALADGAQRIKNANSHARCYRRAREAAKKVLDQLRAETRRWEACRQPPTEEEVRRRAERDRAFFAMLALHDADSETVE